MIKLILLLLTVYGSLCDRSFTVVIDTTKSMKEELLVVQANLGQVVNAVNNDYDSFVLVPFKDTVVERPFTTHSAQDFTSRLNSLSTSGLRGDDCPENSLAGIEAALRASEKQSTIIVFTDAYAKDYNKFGTIDNLCKETNSQVIIILSGYCVPSEYRQNVDGNKEVYYDIAKACSGAVLTFDTTFEFRTVFQYLKEIFNTAWTNVTTCEKFTDSKQFSFSVDSFTTDFMVVVSGSSPAIQIFSYNSQTLNVERIVQTQNSLVVRLRQPQVGEYTASIRGRESMLVVFYVRNYVPFEFGFSTKPPRSLKETAARPIADKTNYMLIKIDSSIKLYSVEWLYLGNSAKQVLLLEEKLSGFYITNIFVNKGKTFRFWIIGEDTGTLHRIKGSSKVLAPQAEYGNNERLSIITAEILDTELGLIDFGKSLTLACKVVANPVPEVNWRDEQNDMSFQSEKTVLEIPSVYISYVTISNVTKNFTMVCNCQNSEGTAQSSIDVFVNRTFSFDVIKEPEDASVEFGNEHYLYCQVDAYPEAQIKWYLNETLVDPNTNSRVSLEDNALVIKSMSFEDIGTYECMAYNEVQSRTFTAAIQITGVYSPEIEESETEINMKPGDQKEIECRISKGSPTPDISWKYRAADAYVYKLLPNGVSSENAKLKFKSADKSHAGVYRCVATNVLGENTKDFSVKMQVPPVIKNSERETISVREGTQVDMACDVEATPDATVRWEMSQDDLIIAFDQRHQTDDKHTHHFQAFYNDAGNYHCVAENSVGKAERTVTLNVLVPPYIEAPKSIYEYVNIGGSAVLMCNVVYGNPAPRTKWEFIPKDSANRKMFSANPTSTLHLDNISPSDEGSYSCIAENYIGTDKIKYYLVIQSL